MSQEKELKEIGIKIKNGEPLSDTEKRVYVDCYKKSWFEDPIWDMEDLGDQEGFEEFKEELLDFKKESEEYWEKKRMIEQLNIYKKIDKKGLYNYIFSLEERISRLEEREE